MVLVLPGSVTLDIGFVFVDGGVVIVCANGDAVEMFCVGPDPVVVTGVAAVDPSVVFDEGCEVVGSVQLP